MLEKVFLNFRFWWLFLHWFDARNSPEQNFCNTTMAFWGQVQIACSHTSPSAQLWRLGFQVLRFVASPWLVSNQIYLVTFTNTQLTQASFLQKKSNIAKWFFDSCNAETAQSLSSLQKSEFLKLIILIFHVKKLNN
jgi:hypothetical protein